MTKTRFFSKCAPAPPSCMAMVVCLLAGCSASEPSPLREANPSHASEKVLDEKESELEFGLVAEGKLCGTDNTLHVRIRPRGIGSCLVQIPGSSRNAHVYSDEGPGEPVPLSYASTGDPVVTWHELGLGLIGASPFAEASAQLIREEPVSRFLNAKLLLRVTILKPDGTGKYKRENILLPIRVELSND
jgi:hypothetical protein